MRMNALLNCKANCTTIAMIMHKTIAALYGIIPMGKNRYITVLNPDGACMSNYRHI